MQREDAPVVCHPRPPPTLPITTLPITEVNQNHMQDAYMLASEQQHMMEQQSSHEQNQRQSTYTSQQVQHAQYNAVSRQVQNDQQPPPSHTMQVHMQQQNIMDLCGETFSTQSIAQHDVDSMAEYMESDFTPDPQQYKAREQHNLGNHVQGLGRGRAMRN